MKNMMLKTAAVAVTCVMALPSYGARACGFSKKDDGLYITRGIMILVR